MFFTNSDVDATDVDIEDYFYVFSLAVGAILTSLLVRISEWLAYKLVSTDFYDYWADSVNIYVIPSVARARTTRIFEEETNTDN